MSGQLTNGDAQAVGADEVLAAVAAGDLLAVAADGAVVLAGDIDLGVARLLVHGRGGSSLGGSDLGGGGLGAVAGGSGDEGGHGGDEESLHEGHFVGLVLGWWGWWFGGSGWLVEWEASVLDWKSGLDVLDDERKLGWRAMEMGVLIPVWKSLWLVTFCWLSVSCVW